jgi:CSLREA domain-containing protein
MKSNFLATRLNLILVIILITSIGAALWQTQTGSAASVIEVNTSEDVSKNDGQCSLREAVTSANKDSKSGGKPGECSAGSGPDTILLPAGIYTLSKSDNGQEDSSSTGDLDIRGDLYIIGDGPDSTMVEASTTWTH